MSLGRRAFLERLARAGIASATLSALPPWAHALAANATRPKAATSADLIERNDWPEHWETTLQGLGRSWDTSNDRFFVRSHFPVPHIQPEAYRLEVTGKVDHPLSLGLADLERMAQTEVVHTLECAGNGRGLMKLPSTSGTQWERGAVGNAYWRGVRLSLVLQRAGASPDARHVWFEAADQAVLPQAPPFLRSIPLEKAMTDVVLAHSMNDQPLSALHGAPLRAVVPGWYGMASTKWVTRLRVEKEPSDNHFMVKGYRYVAPGQDPATAPPVEEIKVKSVITRPLAGARVARGKVRIQGFAWAGPAGVRLVEVSTDGGRSWRPAGFMGVSATLAWRQWATEIDARNPATMTAQARATDGAGAVQPIEAPLNLGGYGNNSIHKVTFHVV